MRATLKKHTFIVKNIRFIIDRKNFLKKLYFFQKKLCLKKTGLFL
ncbi:hypothetical protein CLS_30430 [[Clostridium] cf. saccharolyticum K10]|nr:hypothetical protein CLS_30430 [[Clostridium] cf. saccharolyticum K10]